MDPRLKRRKSLKVLIALIAILLVLAPFSLADTDVSKMDIKEVSKNVNGSTVFAGDELIDNSNVNKYPLAININYLFSQFLAGDIIGGLFSIVTGTVPVPATELVEGNVTNTGLVAEFEGPGFIEFKNNKIIVHSPNNTVWGYNDPYTRAVKTEDGIDIVNVKTNKTLNHISGDNINNDSVGKNYLVDGTTLKNWYDQADVGDQYNLEFCLSKFNDGRSYVTPDLLRQHFPEAYNYSVKYPGGSPVLIYKNSSYKEHVVSSSYTYLGDHSEYGSGANANREINARQFCVGWNGTVIPPNSSSTGKEGISFTSIKDSEASGGWVSHGVCPPARTLRNAVMELGMPLPTGMTTGENAVLYGFNPTTGITVTNTLDYPVQVIMWTEGSGTGMACYCKIIEYKPGNVDTNTTNTTVEE